VDNARETAGVSEGWVVSKANVYAMDMELRHYGSFEMFRATDSGGDCLSASCDDDGECRLDFGDAVAVFSPEKALALAAYIQRVWGEA
jgi:hypothetical protein